MRSVFLAGLIITICCVGYSIGRIFNNQKQIAKEMKKLFLACLVSLITHAGLLLTSDLRILNILYCFFFSSVTWIVFYLTKFVLLFAGRKLEKYRFLVPLLILMILDTINLFCNLIFNHCFGITFVESRTGEIFPRYTFGWGFIVHLIVCYIPLVDVFLILIIESIKSPKIFRRKYIVYLIMLGGILGIDAVYLWAGGSMDLSVFCFSFGALISYYFAVSFVPRLLLSHSFFRMTDSMKAGLLVFDIAGELVYTNPSAKSIFETKENLQELAVKNASVWMKKSMESSDYDELNKKIDEKINGKIKYLDVYYKALRDTKTRFLGGYFLIEDRTEDVEKTNAELKAARYDKLTGVYNFDYFIKRATKMLEENSDKEYVFMISDIKNFKLVNDIFGQQTGDSILIQIANELRQRSDDTVVYGRYNNDSFVLLMEKKDLVVQVFTDVPEQVIKVDDNVSYPLQIYFGVYNIPDNSMHVHVMCDRAIIALKSVSGDFSTRVGFFDEQMLEDLTNQQMLVADMKTAVEKEEFVVYLQPQLNRDEKVIGAEALVRWQHPSKGLLSPTSFIGILENNGSVVQMDMYVWEQVCKLLHKWKNEGKEDYYISINISPNDFYVTDVYSVLTNLVEKYNINPLNLKLEITETAIMRDLEKQIALIERLRKYGFMVEMDDFGSAYSSLNMLKEISVDVIKLDMAFLGATREPLRARRIMAGIINLAKELDTPVIAEGVETEIQVNFLKEIGCDMFQGFYFAKPMDVASFEEKYM